MDEREATNKLYADPSLPLGADYACRIVQDFFGDVCEIVYRRLLTAGPSGLRGIGVGTRMSRSEVTSGLMVLIQHSFVRVVIRDDIPSTRSSQLQHMYMADPARVIASIRQPAFLVYVADQYGEVAECVCKQLACHGRLPLSAIIERVAVEVASAGLRPADQCGMEGVAVEDATIARRASAAIITLVQERLVEQVPPCSLPLINPPDAAASLRRGRAKISDERKRLAAHQKLAHEQYQKVRYQLPQAALDSVAGASARHCGVGGGHEEAATLFRLNFDAFAVHFRHEAFVDFISAMQGEAVGEVARAMLDLTRPGDLLSLGRHGTAAPMPAAALSAADISRRYRDNAATQRAPDAQLAQVDEALAALVNTDFVQHADGRDDGKLVFAQELMIYMLLNNELGNFLKRRFGERGHRIWRILVDAKHLSVDQVERSALVTTRCARMLLSALFRHGYASVQEVPRSAERAPGKTIYLYHVDLLKAASQMLSDIYKAARNLMSRAAFEYERHRDVLELAQRKLRGDDVKLTAEQVAAAERWRAVNRTLHSALLRLDGILRVYSYSTV